MVDEIQVAGKLRHESRLLAGPVAWRGRTVRPGSVVVRRGNQLDVLGGVVARDARDVDGGDV